MKPKGFFIYNRNLNTDEYHPSDFKYGDTDWLRSLYEKLIVIPEGHFLVDINFLEPLFRREPEMKMKPLDLFKIPFSQGKHEGFEFALVNLWDALSSQNLQNRVLLASDLSVQIAVSFSDRMKELIFVISREPRVLRSLNSRKVEELVAGLIEDKGFMVELTAKTRDGGRDIIAVKGKGELLKDEKYLIEVKHPAPDNPVSVGAVRELVGVGEVDPNTGLILVSTTRFTKDAVELAVREALRYRLALRDYSDLMAWVETYCKKRKD